jgi:peptide/nickel transport system substrate-binding protein
MQRSVQISVAVAVVGAFAFVAPQLGSTPSNERAAAKADQTFRYAYQGELKSLDPYALNETFTLGTLANVYEGLVVRDAEMKLKPGLAQSWEQISETTWRFHLRKGVTFHNGNTFDADDVVFSADRIRSKVSNLKGRVPASAKFRKVDTHTVDLVLEKPNPVVFAEWETFAILDREWTEAAIAKHGETALATKANGTGPFRVAEHAPGVKTVFEINNNWWGERAHNLARVEFTPIKSDATRIAALMAGDVDMVYPVPSQDIARIRQQAELTVLTAPELRTVFLGFDQWRPELVGSDIKGRNPFKDARVRRAVALAVDRNAIKKMVMRGQSEPAATLIAPALFSRASEVEGFGYEPDRARSLLAEAGYENGFSIQMDCPNNRYVNDEAICQAVVTYLAKIGIKVSLNAQPKSQFFGKILAKGGYDSSFFLIGWTPSSMEAGSLIRHVVMCRDREKATGVFNIGGYCNRDVDALAETLMSEADPDRRDALVLDILQKVNADAGFVPLHQQALAWAARDGVALRMRADNGLRFKWIRKN